MICPTLCHLGSQVEWKLKRGKWRPKLLDYAKNASADEVKATTKKAFGLLGNDAVPTVQQVKDSLDELISLKVCIQPLSTVCICASSLEICTARDSHCIQQSEHAVAALCCMRSAS